MRNIQGLQVLLSLQQDVYSSDFQTKTLSSMPLKPFQWLGYWQLWRSRRARQEMTELLWNCRKCGGSDDRMEAVPGRRRWFLFGERKPKLIAICLDCWSEMEFLGTV